MKKVLAATVLLLMSSGSICLAVSGQTPIVKKGWNKIASDISGSLTSLLLSCSVSASRLNGFWRRPSELAGANIRCERDVLGPSPTPVASIKPDVVGYNVPVLVLKYLPDENGDGRVDENITGINETVENIRNKTDRIDTRLIKTLDGGGRFHGYKDQASESVFNYSIYQTKEFNYPIPRQKDESERVVDGDISTGKWHPSAPFVGKNLLIDMLSEKNISTVLLHFYSDDKPVGYHVEASRTGNFSGEQLTLFTENNSLIVGEGDNRYDFNPVDARYLKLVIDKYRNDDPGGTNHQVNLYEFSVGFDISNATVTSSDGLNYSSPADHRKLLSDINICNLVNDSLVKEVWIWMYHVARIYPVESFQIGPTGGIGNGYMDLPVCDNSYTVYDYNFGRDLGEALEDHTHHIEAVLQGANFYKWWRDFTGGFYEDPKEGLCSGLNPVCANPDGSRFNRAQNQNSPLHCGWTHCPPNVILSDCKSGSELWPSGNKCQCQGYSWYSQKEVLSDCEDWKADGSGVKTQVTCHNWAGATCNDDGGVAFKVWWMQNIPSRWWVWIGDYDGAKQAGVGLQ